MVGVSVVSDAGKDNTFVNKWTLYYNKCKINIYILSTNLTLSQTQEFEFQFTAPVWRCETRARPRSSGARLVAARGRGRGGGGAWLAPLAQHDDAAVAVGGARHLLVAVAGRTADGRHKHSTGGDGSCLGRFLSIINLEYEGNTRGGHVARPPASPASPPAANTQVPELQAAHYCGEWGRGP